MLDNRVSVFVSHNEVPGHARSARPSSYHWPNRVRYVARKYSKSNAQTEHIPEKGGEAVAPVECWLCNRPLGTTTVLHHPIPKSRGGREVVPMHPICQQTLNAQFSNAELQRHGLDVEAILINPNMRKFVDWVAKKEPDFHASTAKKKR